jgi:flagellar protein FliO/FliZ
MKFLILSLGFAYCLAAPAKEVLSKEATDLLTETQGAAALAAVTAPSALPEKNIVAEELKVVSTGEAVAVTVPLKDAGAAIGSAATGSEASTPLKEEEIPLNFDKKSATAGNESPIMRVILALGILSIMAAGAFYLYRRHGRPGPKKNAPQIKVLTQHWLGPKKSIAIIRVAGESILIGVTDHNISMIKSLALMDEEIPQDTPENFGSVMSAVEVRSEKNAAFTKANSAASAKGTFYAKASEVDSADAESDEFQMSGLNQIKDVVSQRLKNMRSFE